MLHILGPFDLCPRIMSILFWALSHYSCTWTSWELSIVIKPRTPVWICAHWLSGLVSCWGLGLLPYTFGWWVTVLISLDFRRIIVGSDGGVFNILYSVSGLFLWVSAFCVSVWVCVYFIPSFSLPPMFGVFLKTPSVDGMAWFTLVWFFRCIYTPTVLGGWWR